MMLPSSSSTSPLPSTRLASTLLAVSLSLVPAALAGADLIGPASVGMGGARVASVDDNSAIFINPAMLGFFNRLDDEGERHAADNRAMGTSVFGVGLPDFTLTIGMHGQLADYIDRMQDLKVNALDQLGNGGSTSVQDLEDVIATLNLLESYDATKDVVTLDANVGLLSLRGWHVGVGLRGHLSSALGIADIDTANIGLTDTLNNAINGISMSVPGGYTPQRLDGAQQASLGNAGLDANAINRLDIALGNAGLSDREIDALMGTSGDPGLLLRLAQLGGGGSFDDNTTSALVRGLAYVELPVAFGYAIDDHWAVGGAFKFMAGKNGAAKIRLTKGIDEVGNYLDNAVDDAVQSSTIGIDLGVTWRRPWIQVGLVGKNLNNPSFSGGTLRDSAGDGFRLGEATLERQFTLGAAFMPLTWMTLEADLDLNARTSPVFDYDQQHLSLGAHLELLRILDLRAGWSRNLAESDIGDRIHIGVGLDLWAVQFNLAGAASLDTTPVGGEDVIKEMTVSAGLTMEF